MRPISMTAVLSAALMVCLAGGTLIAPAQDAQQPAAQRQDQALDIENVELPTRGVAVLRPTEGNDVEGVILFEQRGSALHLSGKVTNLEPGLHGFHIHEYGDLRDSQGLSAGDHFNPEGERHGGPDDPAHHAGDLGNIEAGEDGVATIDVEAPWLKLHFVVGRALVVHEGRDDFTSQPSGDAGARVALGVIGIAGPPSERQATR